MNVKKTKCIICPIKCDLKIFLKDDHIVKMEGYSCKKGLVYAKKDCKASVSFVKGTIKVIGGQLKEVSVMSEFPVSRDKVFKIIKEINRAEVKASVKKGDIIIENVVGIGINIIATTYVNKKSTS